MDKYHTSVLLQEVIDQLQVKPGKRYIDGTLGGGGHTLAILEKGGVVLGIDVDQDALENLEEKVKIQNSKFKNTVKNLKVIKGNFREIDRIAKENGFGNVDGILLDLGVSGHQFDERIRGFSYLDNAPLDMRMDQHLQVTAKDLVNGLTKQELTELFRKYGEERFAPVIARNIVKAREEKLIETTTELVEIVKRSVFLKHEGVNPATRVFQALRIAVNDELRSLEEALPRCIELLASGGRLAVISFHSLEDRIVKNSFIAFEKNGLGKIVTKKPIIPTEEEIGENRRSRSAKLRVFEKR